MIATDDMLGNLDRVMRQLRRRPQKTRYTGRGIYRLLKIISETPGISTRELAERMDIRPASLNEKLVRLEEKEIIKRERDSKDKRVHVVYLGSVGTSHLARSKEMRAKINESINTVLTLEEIQELARLSKKLALGLENIDTTNERVQSEREEKKEGK